MGIARVVAAVLALLVAAGGPARADVPGRFDYYVLALSWSPGWCALEGDARRAPECAAGAGRGLSLHGLWPQYERGWPRDCRAAVPDATRAQTAAMADIMGSAGLAWHEWKAHGRCSGLTAQAYFDLSRRAYEAIRAPAALAGAGGEALSPARVEALMLAANPALGPDGVTVRCRSGRLTELRICLTRALEPRNCAADTRQDCNLETIDIEPLR
ncbi:ribonuclease T2 [Oceanicella sp. SM1341]|uniref:ribonuclease T2 family protein n=1 Tax=Oceanicella sp. SM1341 TaxID=1548889 RepID=UPI000E555CF0|nr:ribonuclease T2 [Oceanicella sp. SM1341]